MVKFIYITSFIQKYTLKLLKYGLVFVVRVQCRDIEMRHLLSFCFVIATSFYYFGRIFYFESSNIHKTVLLILVTFVYVGYMSISIFYCESLQSSSEGTGNNTSFSRVSDCTLFGITKITSSMYHTYIIRNFLMFFLRR